jgi:hypothetical protein
MQDVNLSDNYNLILSLFTMLAIVSSGCERATKQMLEDPSNLFVIDLATSVSEAKGIPMGLQSMACLFLGCAFLSFPLLDSTKELELGYGSINNSNLSRKSLLKMVDSRIGLTNFTDLLKNPLKISKNDKNIDSIFFSNGFRNFYSSQVELIRTGIFDYYSSYSGIY